MNPTPIYDEMLREYGDYKAANFGLVSRPSSSQPQRRKPPRQPTDRLVKQSSQKRTA